MTDLGTMIGRIDREMRRDAITADITAAIETAIHHYEADRFLFNEAELSANLTTGNNTLALPTGTIEVDSLQMTVSSSRQPPMRRITQKEMDERDDGSVTGQPSRYAVYRNQLRFDAFANAVYPMKISVMHELTGVSSSATSGATNGWMTDGEEMIRLKAKSIIFFDRLRNAEQGGIMEARAQQARMRLKQKSTKLIATDTIAKRQF